MNFPQTNYATHPIRRTDRSMAIITIIGHSNRNDRFIIHTQKTRANLKISRLYKRSLDENETTHRTIFERSGLPDFCRRWFFPTQKDSIMRQVFSFWWRLTTDLNLAFDCEIIHFHRTNGRSLHESMTNVRSVTYQCWYSNRCMYYYCCFMEIFTFWLIRCLQLLC